MARKDRVPNPPKRPQGPQRRSTPADPAATARQRRLLYVIAGSGLAALAVVLAIVFLAGGADGGGRAALEDAGCTLEVKPGQSAEHSVEQLTATSDKWNTDPPSSGPHNAQPAVWGFYDDPVPFAQTVHNLEHGGVVIYYGPGVPDGDVEAMRSLYAEDPNGLVVAALPKLGKRIALTAWTTADDPSGEENENGEGFLATCPKFDEGAVSSFIDEHRFKGPERFPPESLTPGS